MKIKAIIFDWGRTLFDSSTKEILIVDDRVIRGVKYGNKNGHPTVWFQNGKFASELPNEDTGMPTYIIQNLDQIKTIISKGF